MNKQTATTLREATGVGARQGTREMDIIAQVRPILCTLADVSVAGG